MGVSPKHIDKSVTRFTFNSELECRKQGGTPTNVLFKNGYCHFKSYPTRINYNIPTMDFTKSSVRFIVRFTSLTNNQNIFGVLNTAVHGFYLDSTNNRFVHKVYGTNYYIPNASTYLNSWIEVVLTYGTGGAAYINGLLISNGWGTSPYRSIKLVIGSQLDVNNVFLGDI